MAMTPNYYLLVPLFGIPFNPSVSKYILGTRNPFFGTKCISGVFKISDIKVTYLGTRLIL